MPLSLDGTALLARYLAGLPWLKSFLLGAVLNTTDPVFAEAIVYREERPARLRKLLNIESGLNDGLTFPLVVILPAVAGEGEFHLAPIRLKRLSSSRATRYTHRKTTLPSGALMSPRFLTESFGQGIPLQWCPY